MEKRIVIMEEFGKDHWGLFGYILTRCMDYKGVLAREHLSIRSGKYPTRLKGYFDDKDNPKLSIKNYGDEDCLEDLERERLIRRKDIYVIQITDRGFKVLIELIKHKSFGGQYATFEYKK